jgi:hypothetical protein
MKVPDAEVSDEAQVEVMWHVLLVSAVVLCGPIVQLRATKEVVQLDRIGFYGASQSQCHIAIHKTILL